MVAKLPVFEGETDDATAMAYGFIPGISKWSPFHGAAYAVMVSLAKLAAMEMCIRDRGRAVRGGNR